jgi:hypothetical protein
VIVYAEEGDQADRAAEILNEAGAEDLDTLRENLTSR